MAQSYRARRPAVPLQEGETPYRGSASPAATAPKALSGRRAASEALTQRLVACQARAVGPLSLPHARTCESPEYHLDCL